MAILLEQKLAKILTSPKPPQAGELAALIAEAESSAVCLEKAAAET